jgi:tRNA (guanosine-2'-O-)-methyltransferase
LDREDPQAFEPHAGDFKEPPWSRDWTAAGVIAALEPIVNAERRERLLCVLSERLESVTLVMDAPHDPHNGAAILRSCDAFGVQQVHVVCRREPFLVARRVTQGAERWVDVASYTTAERALSQLRARRFTLVTTHPNGSLLPEQLAEIPRLALVLGNEHDGICSALSDAACASVRIPMRGFAESLNVSVSAAILLSHATRRAGDLDREAKELLYARWLFQSLTRAADILAALRSPRGGCL